MRVALLIFEALLFLVVPLLLFFKIVDIFEVWLLIISATYPLIYLYRSGFDFKSLLKMPNSAQIKWVLKRFAFFGSLLSVLVLLFFDDMLFSFIIEKPYIFLAVFLLYPILSALPQEVIYRVFYFYRYEKFFQNPTLFLALNALIFAYMHIVFDNIYAPILSFVGGVLFVHNYYKHRNFLLVLFEHTLYGWLIFTLGIGRFFYIGG